MKPKGIAVVTLVASALLVGASVGATTKSGTPTQVAAAVKASVSITSIPSGLTPSLSEFSNPVAAETYGGMHTLHACNPYAYSKLVSHPIPCFGGNLKGKETLAFVGDSNVGNWAAGLMAGLATSKYRIAAFPYPGCSTPDMTYTSQHQLDGTTPAECNTWHKAVLKVIKGLHPYAIIAVSAPFGSTSGANETTWIAGMKKLFVQATLGAPSTKRILIGTSPAHPTAVPTCLVGNSNPQSCAVPDTPGSAYGDFLARDALIAKAADATLVSVDPFLCYGGSCSPIISKYLVYVDIDHISIAYSQYAAQVISDAVLKAL